MDFIVKFSAAGVFWAGALVGVSCAVVVCEVNASKLNAMAMTEAKRKVGLRFIFDRWVEVENGYRAQARRQHFTARMIGRQILFL